MAFLFRVGNPGSKRVVLSIVLSQFHELNFHLLKLTSDRSLLRVVVERQKRHQTLVISARARGSIVR